MVVQRIAQRVVQRLQKIGQKGAKVDTKVA